MSYKLWLIVTHTIVSLWAIWLLQNIHKLYGALMFIHIVSISWLKTLKNLIGQKKC